VSKLSREFFAFAEGLLLVDDMSREQLIQALEWTLEALSKKEDQLDRINDLLDLRKTYKKTWKW